jgi:ribosome-binding factor A
MTKRIQRVNQLIKKELSQILLREIEFPHEVLATITRVETSSNLIESNVWISVLPEEESERILEILNKNIYFLQQKLNKRLKMRPIPRIKFLEERKTIEAAKIEEVLEELKKEGK